MQGIKVKMDDQGNILVKRVSKCNVYVKSTAQGDETAIGNDVLKLPNCALELEKPVKVRCCAWPTWRLPGVRGVLSALPCAMGCLPAARQARRAPPA